MAKVSVIMPTFNYAKFILKTLDSLNEQTYKDFEVIVVDDGSTDETAELVKKSPVKIKYIRHQKNLGFSEALNSGIKAAKGEFLNFLSADDLLLPKFLEKEVSILEKYPKIGLIYSGVIYINAEGKSIKKQPLRKLDLRGKDSYLKLLIGNHINLVSTLVRRSIIRKVGGFNPKLNQMTDWDMWLRVAKSANIGYIPQYLALYRIHPKSLTSAIRRDFENIGKERKIIFDQTIKDDIPVKIAPFIKLLFLDAMMSGLRVPNFLVKFISIFTTGISIFTVRLFRKKFSGY